MLVKRAAGVVNLLEAGWVLYIVILFMNAPSSCPSGGCPPIANSWVFNVLLLLGSVLFVVAAVSFTGRWWAFPVAALLSLFTMPLIALQIEALGTAFAIAALILAVAGLIFDVVASISKGQISEQEHPLNLPVFG